MIGFAVASYRENKIGGFLAQGIGTSMLQVPNIMRHPLIWIPSILSSAILGPVSTMLLHMTNNATGSGMGTAAGWSVDDVAGDDPDRRSDDCSGEDHCDPVCTSGSDHTWNFRIYEKEGLDSQGDMKLEL